MSFPWNITNPGFTIGNQLTSGEAAFVVNLAGLTYAQGDILYYNGSDLTNLGPGTSGQLLQTQGAGANPQWTTASGVGDMLEAVYDAAAIAEQLVGLTATQTLTNKSIDADNNTITNIGVAEFDTDTADSFGIINAMALDDPSITVTSNGTTILLNLEKSGTGDIRFVMSDGVHTHDCTPTATVALTAGTDSNPQINYIYILQSTKVLTASTSLWPASEHAPVATVLCQSAASLQTDGAYKVHAWTDHAKNGNNMGHLSHLNHWVRQQPATWESGVALTSSVGAATFDVSTTAGLVLQLHDHTMPAFDTSTGSDIYIVNDNTTAYDKLGDLTTATSDSTGTSMTGNWYHLVIWGAVNEATGDCKLYCNLPNASYNNDNGSQATNDVDGTAIYDIPANFTGVGFLIARLLISESGGTFTEEANVDLRGLFPSTGAGGSGGGGGVSEWTELTDTPSSYVSQALSLVQVASGETALEFTTAPTITTTNITDVTDKRFMTDAQETLLDSVETNADVTDTTNVTAAGALMDSEVDADIKTLTIAASSSISGSNTGDEAASSTTVAGVSELTTTTEVDTGTDTTRAVTADALQGSFRNLRFIDFIVVDPATDVEVATDLVTWSAPFAGTIVQDDTDVDYFAAYTTTAGTTGTMVIDIHKGGTTIMTTNKLDIETTELDTTLAATQPDLTTTTFSKGDVFTIDVDAIHTTAAKGLTVRMAVRPD